MHNAKQKRERRQKKAKEQQLAEYEKKVQEAMRAKKARIIIICLFISISLYLLAVIIYGVVVARQDVFNSIYDSSACIAPIVGGGFLSAAVAGAACGWFRFPYISFVPAIIVAICAFAMIGGMLSHDDGIFIDAVVIIVFGIVGLVVTALVGALGGFLAGLVAEDHTLFEFAEKKCDNEYRRLVDAKKRELGL